jgi:hypothetical protein
MWKSRRGEVLGARTPPFPLENLGNAIWDGVRIAEDRMDRKSLYPLNGCSVDVVFATLDVLKRFFYLDCINGNS